MPKYTLHGNFCLLIALILSSCSMDSINRRFARGSANQYSASYDELFLANCDDNNTCEIVTEDECDQLTCVDNYIDHVLDNRDEDLYNLFFANCDGKNSCEIVSDKECGSENCGANVMEYLRNKARISNRRSVDSKGSELTRSSFVFSPSRQKKASIYMKNVKGFDESKRYVFRRSEKRRFKVYDKQTRNFNLKSKATAETLDKLYKFRRYLIHPDKFEMIDYCRENGCKNLNIEFSHPSNNRVSTRSFSLTSNVSEPSDESSLGAGNTEAEENLKTELQENSALAQTFENCGFDISDVNGCDYSDALANGGKGVAITAGKSCPSLFESEASGGSCSWEDANKYDGWGWDEENERSCHPDERLSGEENKDDEDGKTTVSFSDGDKTEKSDMFINKESQETASQNGLSSEDVGEVSSEDMEGSSSLFAMDDDAGIASLECSDIIKAVGPASDSDRFRVDFGREKQQQRWASDTREVIAKLSELLAGEKEGSDIHRGLKEKINVCKTENVYCINPIESTREDSMNAYKKSPPICQDHIMPMDEGKVMQVELDYDEDGKLKSYSGYDYYYDVVKGNSYGGGETEGPSIETLIDPEDTITATNDVADLVVPKKGVGKIVSSVTGVIGKVAIAYGVVEIIVGLGDAIAETFNYGKTEKSATNYCPAGRVNFDTNTHNKNFKDCWSVPDEDGKIWAEEKCVKEAEDEVGKFYNEYENEALLMGLSYRVPSSENIKDKANRRRLCEMACEEKGWMCLEQKWIYTEAGYYANGYRPQEYANDYGRQYSLARINCVSANPEKFPITKIKQKSVIYAWKIKKVGTSQYKRAKLGEEQCQKNNMQFLGVHNNVDNWEELDELINEEGSVRKFLDGKSKSHREGDEGPNDFERILVTRCLEPGVLK